MSRWNPQSVQERFEDRFIPEPNSGCWLWTGEIDAYGYGSFYLAKIKEGSRWRKTRAKAHRLSWALHYSEPPAELEVCHRCDVPACVNPEHLFLGTHAENQRDMVQKNRHSRGERQGSARLTEAAVREIMASALTSQSLADRFGVSMASVNDVRRGVTWAHLGLARTDDAKTNQGQPGSAHAGAILTEADIPPIRARLAAGEGCTSIGRSFGVSDAVIRHVKSGKTWRNA